MCGSVRRGARDAPAPMRRLMSSSSAVPSVSRANPRRRPEMTGKLRKVLMAVLALAALAAGGAAIAGATGGAKGDRNDPVPPAADAARATRAALAHTGGGHANAV